MKVGVAVSISAGETTVTYTEKKVEIGEQVEFVSVCGEFVGNKPIAIGKVIGCCGDEPGAPITPTHGGQVANAWRNYYRILVTEIL